MSASAPLLDAGAAAPGRRTWVPPVVKTHAVELRLAILAMAVVVASTLVLYVLWRLAEGMALGELNALAAIGASAICTCIAVAAWPGMAVAKITAAEPDVQIICIGTFNTAVFYYTLYTMGKAALVLYSQKEKHIFACMVVAGVLICPSVVLYIRGSKELTARKWLCFTLQVEPAMLWLRMWKLFVTVTEEPDHDGFLHLRDSATVVDNMRKCQSELSVATSPQKYDQVLGISIILASIGEGDQARATWTAVVVGVASMAFKAVSVDLESTVSRSIGDGVPMIVGRLSPDVFSPDENWSFLLLLSILRYTEITMSFTTVVSFHEAAKGALQAHLCLAGPLMLAAFLAMLWLACRIGGSCNPKWQQEMLNNAFYYAAPLTLPWEAKCMTTSAYRYYLLRFGHAAAALLGAWVLMPTWSVLMSLAAASMAAFAPLLALSWCCQPKARPPATILHSVLRQMQEVPVTKTIYGSELETLQSAYEIFMGTTPPALDAEVINTLSVKEGWFSATEVEIEAVAEKIEATGASTALHIDFLDIPTWQRGKKGEKGWRMTKALRIMMALRARTAATTVGRLSFLLHHHSMNKEHRGPETEEQVGLLIEVLLLLRSIGELVMYHTDVELIQAMACSCGNVHIRKLLVSEHSDDRDDPLLTKKNVRCLEGFVQCASPSILIRTRSGPSSDVSSGVLWTPRARAVATLTPSQFVVDSDDLAIPDMADSASDLVHSCKDLGKDILIKVTLRHINNTDSMSAWIRKLLQRGSIAISQVYVAVERDSRAAFCFGALGIVSNRPHSITSQDIGKGGANQLNLEGLEQLRVCLE